MKYEKGLRQLVKNLLREHRCGTDYYISCPQPGCGTSMEFSKHGCRGSWHCLRRGLRRGCGFTIPEEELPGPAKIEELIREVKSEKRIEEIKNIIRETIQKEV